MKQKLQPNLRFPEFNGEWEMKKLGEVCEIIGGGTPDTNIPEYWGGEIQWFTPTEIKSDFVSNSIRTITELGLQKSSAKNLPIGTILLTTRATIGEVSIASKECSTNQGFQSLIARKGNSNIFIFNWIKQNKYLLTSRANGSTFPEISKSEIEKIILTAPSLPEQTKIASFITAVDDKLHALKQKHALLEQYKKGVMQKIFTQELRFKPSPIEALEIGDEYPDWEEKKLGEVASFRRGSFPQPYGLPEWYDNENGYPFIQVYDVDDNMLLKPYTKNKISELATKQSVFVKKGTIVITIQGSIGRIAKTQYHAYIDRTLLIFQSYKVPINIDYFKYVLFLLFEIEKTKAPGGTIKTITKEVLTDFKVLIPSLSEQTKIASFLFTLDEKINQCQAQIAKTEVWKKGLLQQLFV